MDKFYIKRMFTSTLTPYEQELVQICAIICCEPYSIDAFIRFFGLSDQHSLDSIIRSLIERKWFSNVFGNDFCCTESVGEAILELVPPTIELLDSFLDKHHEMLINADYSSARSLFEGAARLLQYIMNHALIQVCHQTFVESVLAFADHAELAFALNRKGVKWLEERLDFQLLMATERIVDRKSLLHACLSIKIGKLFTNCFRYDDARIRLERASQILISMDGVQLDNIVELYLAYARFYEFQGHFANAIDWAYRAHRIKPTDGQVCAYISYACALVDARKSSKRWAEKAKQLIGDVPEVHPIRIILFQISALQSRDSKDLEKSLSYLDRANHLANHIWGQRSPWAAWLAATRQAVHGSAFLCHQSSDAFREYVEINHYNFGYSLGATAILYAGYIMDEMFYGNHATANKYLPLLLSLKADTSSVSPLVRLTEYIALTIIYAVNRQYDDAKQYIKRAWDLYNHELLPNREVLSAIAPVFNNKIPVGLMHSDYIESVLGLSVNVGCLSEDLSESIELIKLTESNDYLSKQWYFHVLQSRVAIAQGETDDAKRIWTELLNTSNKKSFSRAKEIAECAYFHGLLHDARAMYELALTTPVVDFATTQDLIDAKTGYANVLAECGQTQQADEMFISAIEIAERIGNQEKEALLYYEWANIHQDLKAVQLLELAIERWKPYSVFDERLSHMYRLLAINLAMIGRHEESRKAARKALNLYPTDCPPEAFSEDLNALF